MTKNSRIYIAGHTGLAGSAIRRVLKKAGYRNIITELHAGLELTNPLSVFKYFAEVLPEYVILCAAKVGGIHANSTYPAEFIFSNLQIQTNIIDACKAFNVKKLIFLGSSCIYPKYATQPITEESLMAGALEPTNSPYATAKIAGIEMCRAYNKQYGTKFISIMPCNMYGINDRYHNMNSHVLPALLERFHVARLHEKPKVTCWGSGTPLREFMYSEDMAEAVKVLLETSPEYDLYNVGSGSEITIKKLAKLIAKVVGYKGRIAWDKSKPDGTPRKIMDSSKMRSAGWEPKFSLEKGLEITHNETFMKGGL